VIAVRFLKHLTPEAKNLERELDERMLQILAEKCFLFRMPPYPPGIYGVVLRIILWALMIFGLGFWIYFARTANPGY